jgi:response regulator RpfG family c-di-GMP phosphodiesterase
VQATTEPSKDARPTILYIGEDRDAHPLLKHSLRAQGYRVLAAYSVEDAADWMGGGYVHADLVLLDLVRRATEEALAAGRQVRRRAMYDGRTPLVVIAEKYGPDVEGTEVNVEGNDWVFYLGEEPDQLSNLLRRLTPAGADVAGD